MDTVLTVCRSC